MATHSSVLAWRIPGMGSRRDRHDWSDLAVAAIKGRGEGLIRGVELAYTHCALLHFLSGLCLILDSLWSRGLWPARCFCPWRFSRQEHWSGLPCPPPGDLPVPGIEPRSPSLQANSLPSEPPGKPKNKGVSSLSLLQGSSQLGNQTRDSCIAGRFLAAELWGKAKICTLLYKK